MKISISLMLGLLLAAPALGELFPDQGETLFQDAPAAVADPVVDPVVIPAPSIMDEPSWVEPSNVMPMPACVSTTCVAVRSARLPVVAFPRRAARVAERTKVAACLTAANDCYQSTATCSACATVETIAAPVYVQAQPCVVAQPAPVQTACVSTVQQTECASVETSCVSSVRRARVPFVQVSFPRHQARVSARMNASGCY